MGREGASDSLVTFWGVAVVQASLGMGISWHHVSSGVLVTEYALDASLPESVARRENLFSYDF